jgi:hypothetical protein
VLTINLPKLAAAANIAEASSIPERARESRSRISSAESCMSGERHETHRVRHSMQAQRRKRRAKSHRDGNGDDVLWPDMGDEGMQQCDLVACLCGHTDESDIMVLCERCNKWQHCDCIGLNGRMIPDRYICFMCQPATSVTRKSFANARWAKGLRDDYYAIRYLQADRIFIDSDDEMVTMLYRLHSLMAEDMTKTESVMRAMNAVALKLEQSHLHNLESMRRFQTHQALLAAHLDSLNECLSIATDVMNDCLSQSRFTPYSDATRKKLQQLYDFYDHHPLQG